MARETMRSKLTRPDRVLHGRTAGYRTRGSEGTLCTVVERENPLPGDCGVTVVPHTPEARDALIDKLAATIGAKAAADAVAVLTGGRL